jgi:Flp pilus assembly protein TadG
VGTIGGMEMLPFGLLLFVVGGLLVTNAWGVVDTKLAVSAASREAVRRYVEAPDETTAGDDARAAADETLRGYGRNPAKATFQIDTDGRGFARCSRVTVRVTHDVPAIALPFIGGYGHSFTAASRSSEVVDPYRSGLPGEAAC